MHEFYKKDVASDYTILNRSAMPWSMKRSTLFNEGIRRLKNCSRSLPWAQKAKHLSDFSNMLRISGYDDRFRYTCIKGVIQRYQELEEMVRRGETDFYRTREKIDQQKQAKGGGNRATWFLKGNTTTTLLTSSTPGSRLKRELQDTLKDTQAPDGGLTMVLEDGGIPIYSGLRRDPFKTQGCQYGQDRECIVEGKQDCSKMGVTYTVECNECIKPSPTRRSSVIAGRRRASKYIGNTGRSCHARGLEHSKAVKSHNKKNPLVKHMIECHEGTNPGFCMKILDGHKTNLSRLVSEGLMISKEEPEALMNSKSEWGRGKTIRFTPTVTNT